MIDCLEVATTAWTERKTNTWVLETLRAKKSLWADIITRKLSYFGHITSQTPMPAKNIMQGMVEGKRERGKEEDLQQAGLTTSS